MLEHNDRYASGTMISGERKHVEFKVVVGDLDIVFFCAWPVPFIETLDK